MLWVRKVMGWVLVGMAVRFVSPVMPEVWSVVLLALVAFAAGIHWGGSTEIRPPSVLSLGSRPEWD
jgi:thiol:disulfide interchange protein